jgi:hypothetical protein
MKAMKLNNKTYKVIEERGSFVYYIDEKGRTKTILANQVELVESEEVVKSDIKVRAKKLNKANFINTEEYLKSDVAEMNKYEFEEYMMKKRQDNLPSSLR